MARSAEDIQGFRDAFRKYLNRDPEQGAISAFEGSGISLQDRIAEILRSGEYAGVQQQQYRDQYAPQFEQIRLGEDRARSNQALLGQQIGQERQTLEEAIADAIKNTQRNQKVQESNFSNQQQDLGIRKSGVTATGLYDIGAESTEQLNRLERTKANSLAALALREAAGTQELSSALREGESTRLGLERQIGRDMAGGNLQNKQFGLQKAKFMQDLYADPFKFGNIPDEELLRILNELGY